MLRRSSLPSTFTLLLVLALVPFAGAQTRVNGVVPACASVAPADLIAEVRPDLAWSPVEVGRGTVGADGAFALRFHDILPTEATAPVLGLFDRSRCDGIVASDEAARIVAVRDLRVIPRGADCAYCGTLGRIYAATQARGSFAATGDVAMMWIHADRAVEVAGTCRYGWGEERVDLRLEPGWNVVLLETVAVHPTDGFCDTREVEVFVGALPPTAIWHFQPDR